MNNIFTESIYKNININQKMLLYFYFVYEFSLYVYNQNSIKKLLLLFLKPKILLKLLDKLNNKTKLLIINCFFINIISLNNNIKKINIEEINRFLKQPKEFEYIYLLYKNINVNNLYCNTIIYYNIINYFLNKKVHLTIRKYINLIYNLNNIYYYIPYFLINIKIFIEESNIDYNKLYYLRNILINYLYQIYIKINYLYQNLILLKDFIDKYNFDFMPLIIDLIIYEPNENIKILFNKDTNISNEELITHQIWDREKYPNPKIMYTINNNINIDIDYYNYHEQIINIKPKNNFDNDLIIKSKEQYSFGNYSNIFIYNEYNYNSTICEIIKYNNYNNDIQKLNNYLLINNNIIILGMSISQKDKILYYKNLIINLLIFIKIHDINIKCKEISSSYNDINYLVNDLYDKNINLKELSIELDNCFINNRLIEPISTYSNSIRTQRIIIITFKYNDIEKKIILCDFANNEKIFDYSDMYEIINTIDKYYKILENELYIHIKDKYILNNNINIIDEEELFYKNDLIFAKIKINNFLNYNKNKTSDIIKPEIILYYKNKIILCINNIYKILNLEINTDNISNDIILQNIIDNIYQLYNKLYMDLIIANNKKILYKNKFYYMNTIKLFIKYLIEKCNFNTFDIFVKNINIIILIFNKIIEINDINRLFSINDNRIIDKWNQIFLIIKKEHNYINFDTDIYIIIDNLFKNLNMNKKIDIFKNIFNNNIFDIYFNQDKNNINCKSIFTYFINILKFILITVYIIHFNLELREKESLFINHFMNILKKDNIKLFKKYNIKLFKNIKNKNILHKDEYFDIYLLPTTNLYIDHCNNNYYLSNDFKINSVLDNIEYESYIYKEYFNIKSKIIIKNIINLYDNPIFNENAIPYININELKKIFNILIIYKNYINILNKYNFYNYNQLKLKNIFNQILNILQNKIIKYNFYEISICYTYIIKLINYLNILVKLLDDDSTNYLKLNTIIDNSVNILLKLINIINNNNNLSIIGLIDTINILEFNDYSYVCDKNNYSNISRFEINKINISNNKIITSLENKLNYKLLNKHDIYNFNYFKNEFEIKK